MWQSFKIDNTKGFGWSHHLPMRAKEVIVDLSFVRHIQFEKDSRVLLPFTEPKEIIRFCEMVGDRAPYLSVKNDGLRLDLTKTDKFGINFLFLRIEFIEGKNSPILINI